MIAIPIIQTIVFGLYVLFIISRYGVLSSISESWYSEGPTRQKFMFVLFIVSISAASVMLHKLSLWFIASGGSLAVVAFAPAFRSDNKIVGILHTGGTILGIAFACYALAIHGVYISTIGCIVSSILLDRLKIKNTTFWTEVADFTWIEVGIFQLMI